MVVLVVFLTLLLLPVQRFRRGGLDAPVRRRVLAIREGFALVAILSTLVWQAWSHYEPVGIGADFLVTALFLGGTYAIGEMAVRSFLRRNGLEPVEGPRGPLY